MCQTTDTEPITTPGYNYYYGSKQTKSRTLTAWTGKMGDVWTMPYRHSRSSTKRQEWYWKKDAVAIKTYIRNRHRYLRDAMAETMRVGNEAAEVTGVQSMNPLCPMVMSFCFTPRTFKSLWNILRKKVVRSDLHKSKSPNNLDNKLGKGEYGSRRATNGDVNKRGKEPSLALEVGVEWSKGISEMSLRVLQLLKADCWDPLPSFPGKMLFPAIPGPWDSPGDIGEVPKKPDITYTIVSVTGNVGMEGRLFPSWSLRPTFKIIA